MANAQQASQQYLEFAYDEVDGSPQRTFTQRDVEERLGLSPDRKREIRRDLINRGLIQDEGKSSYSLRLPAVHSVEEARLNEGRQDEVDQRREERGTYVRTLHELVDGDTGTSLALDELQDEIELAPSAEKRAREYLDEAALIEAGDTTVRLTEQGANWAQNA